MYIRESTQKHKKHKTRYKTYKLAESIRTERGPRQRTVLNLGSDFTLPQSQWKDLSNRIEEIITGQENLFGYPKEIESLAKTYARRIIRRKASVVKRGAASDLFPDYQTVDVNNLDNEHVRTIGAEHVVSETIKELELDQKLTDLGFNQPQQEAALGVIAGRLIHPGSERATHLWLQDISAMDEILNTDFSLLSQDRVYKVSDLLLKRQKEIEDHLSFREKTLFNLEERIILYDLTNTFFEGTGKYNPKARFGHSKDKHSDGPLVTLGLVLDADGFPKRSKVFAGNVSEPKTLEIMIRELSSKFPLIRPLVVMDAGIATEENIEWAKAHSYDYLVVSRKRKREIPPHLNLVTVKADDHTMVRAALLPDDQTGETVVYCHSKAKEQKERGINSLFTQRFEEALRKLQASLSRKSSTKRSEKVVEKIGRLKERFKRVAYRYQITVEKDEKNRVTHILWNQKDTEETNGVYLLRTNRDDFKEQNLWDLYTMLTDIEDAFRCMKSELGLRPINHQKESRVDGHLFITVLAYHILHTIRFKLRKKGIHLRWSTIRERLATQVRITTTMKREDGKVIHIRKTSRAEPFHREIYDALGLSSQPGKITKSIL